jgi:hypothetical protein
MTRFLKSTAIAALVASTAMPAFAAGHMDLETMSCASYNDLSEADRNKVAVMAIDHANAGAGTASDISNDDANVAELAKDVTAAENASGETVESDVNVGGAITDGTEKDEAAAENASGDGMTDPANMDIYAEDIALLNEVCEGPGEVMVIDAAAGIRVGGVK